MKPNPEPRGIALIVCAAVETAAIAGALSGSIDAGTLSVVSSVVTVACLASVAVDLMADSRMRDMRRKGRR